MVFYYRQADRKTGDVLGFVSYDDYRPNNENDNIELEELTVDEFMENVLFNQIVEESEE